MVVLVVRGNFILPSVVALLRCPYLLASPRFSGGLEAGLLRIRLLNS